MHAFSNPAVAAVFDAYPADVRAQLLALRELIFEVAASTPGVGELQETLKWGEPAYLTPHTKSGSTVRLGYKRKQPDTYALYVNCQTTLIDTFRAMFGDEFNFEGNRAVVTREVDGGLETISVQLPAIISTDLRLNEPRYITLPNIMKAKKKQLDVVKPDELGVNTAPRITLLKASEPPVRKAGIKVADVATLIEKLKNEAKAI